MKKRWFDHHPELLEEVKQTVERDHPDLRVAVEGDSVFVRGSYRLESGGEVLDRYQIEIEFPSDYNRSLPLVFETGGRIPRTVDRHVIPSTGRACLLVEEDWLVAMAGSYSFSQFLDVPVRNYFLGQSLVEAGQSWPHGERSHGVAGLLEALAEQFGTNDLHAIRRYLYCFTKDRIKGHWDCPCGSGKTIRRCHVDQIRELQERFTPELAKQFAVRVIAALETEAQARNGAVRGKSATRPSITGEQRS
jgi:hypothetical protein